MSSRPSERELVYCHQCEEEWYRDEHGLTCPNCHSEFTEIIEESHDPREDHIEIPSDSEPEETMPQPNPFHDHHPWRDAPDPDEGDINQFRFRQTGPGRVSITGTFVRTYNPRTGIQGGFTPQGDNARTQVQQNFTSMLSGILGAAARVGSNGHEDGHPPIPGNRPNLQVQQQQGQGGPRFTYSSSTRIFPRDAQNPQAHVEPADDINHIINGLFGSFAPQPPGFRPPDQPTHGGFSDHRQQEQHNSPPPGLPPAIAQLFAAILNPALRNEPYGDAVYTQEAFDRVISQFMEQNATGNAPGPASAEAIAALSKKKISEDMLGQEGRAECSICMDEVNIGEEVTQLPCSHWFHGQCVSAWLSEHDTCPHCRKSISQNSSSTGDIGSGNEQGVQHSHRRQSDGEADGRNRPATRERRPSAPSRPGSAPSASGSRRSSYSRAAPPPPPSRHYGGHFQFSTSSSGDHYNRRQHQQRQSEGSGGGGSGGIADRIRRSLFGSGQDQRR